MQGYQKSLFEMNNLLCFYGPMFIPSYRHNDLSIVITGDEICLVGLHYTVTAVTLLTFLLWLFWGCSGSSLIVAA